MRLIVVEMAKGIKEISTQVEENSHLLGAIMVTIILKAMTTFPNGQIII